jgi:hypothetical protein
LERATAPSEPPPQLPPLPPPRTAPTSPALIHPSPPQAASDVYAPISGEVVEINEELKNETSKVRRQGGPAPG